MKTSDGYIVKLNVLYPSVVFKSKEEYEKHQKTMADAGFHEITIGPTINIEEIKRRRFRK